MIGTFVRAKRIDNHAWAYGSVFLTYYRHTDTYDYWLESRSGIITKNNITTLLFRHPISLYSFRDGGAYVDTDICPIIDPETICPYIGIKDKNNIKIFKDDIVRTKHGRLCRVVWFTSPNYNGWDLAPIEMEHPAPDKYDLWQPENLEVIGNIFDNSE